MEVTRASERTTEVCTKIGWEDILAKSCPLPRVVEGPALVELEQNQVGGIASVSGEPRPRVDRLAYLPEANHRH